MIPAKQHALLVIGNLSHNHFTKIMEEKMYRRVWGEEPNYKIFISHKAEDKHLATSLKSNLRRFDLSCFVAHEDIYPTREWQIEIETALESANCLVALLTEKFPDSDWTNQELGFAYARKIPIVPIRLGKDPYGFIGKFQGLKCDIETEFKKIIQVLLSKDEKMVEHFVTLVENSNSFDSSNDLSTLLSSIESLNESQITRLLDAFKNNNQVSSSMGFRGNKSRTGHKFGFGLLYELERITGRKFEP